jgi:hypothetical protein
LESLDGLLGPQTDLGAPNYSPVWRLLRRRPKPHPVRMKQTQQNMKTKKKPKKAKVNVDPFNKKEEEREDKLI